MHLHVFARDHCFVRVWHRTKVYAYQERRTLQNQPLSRMTSETRAPPRFGECLETLLEHLGPAEQRALAATSRGYRAAA
jgi:hypothetical protein